MTGTASRPAASPLAIRRPVRGGARAARGSPYTHIQRWSGSSVAASSAGSTSQLHSKPPPSRGRQWHKRLRRRLRHGPEAARAITVLSLEWTCATALGAACSAPTTCNLATGNFAVFPNMLALTLPLVAAGGRAEAARQAWPLARPSMPRPVLRCRGATGRAGSAATASPEKVLPICSSLRLNE